MVRKITARILALLVLAPILWSTGQAGAAWYCEGRACGVTPWWCCCSSSSAGRDARCDEPAQNSTVSLGGLAPCPSGCNCVMVISQSTEDHTRPTHAAPLPLAVFALAPTPVAFYFAPALSEIVPHHVEARGPPCIGAAFSPPSLRAPPAA